MEIARIISPPLGALPVRGAGDEYRNPFGITPPCHGERARQAVPGYGEPAADFHLIGDRPAASHPDGDSVPFLGHPAGDQLLEVLQAVGLITTLAETHLTPNNLYLSYLDPCPTTRRDGTMTELDSEIHRYFDAELRAVNAHVLLPVGKRATDHVLEVYTTQARKAPQRMQDRHARDIRGRGFLVVPIMHPQTWTGDAAARLADRLTALLNSDYRQTKGVATLVG